MNIKALRQKKADALKAAKAIKAVADNETRLMTEDETKSFDAHMAQVDTFNASIERTERLMDEERNEAAALAAGRTENNAEKKPWDSLAEQMIAVRRHALGHNTDPRIVAALGSNESSDSEGGILVTPQYTSEILKRSYDVGQITSRTFQMPMSSSRLVMKAVDEDSRVNGSRWGGIQAFWANEAANFQGSKPKFREMSLTANKLTALVYATEEELDDAPALQAYINSAVPDEFGFKLDDACINGVGAGQPLGALTSGAAIVIAAEGGQASKTVVANNILKMWARCYGRSRPTSAWFVNQDVEPQLIPLTLGAGTAVTLMYTPPGMNGNNSPYGLLMGRPVIPVEQSATLGTQGDILLADFQQYLLAQRSGIKADVSMHVAFLTGEQAFRFQLRVDGQPMWKKPLTPKNGANTLSPFVTLAARP